MFSSLDWVPTFVEIAGGPKGDELNKQIMAGKYPASSRPSSMASTSSTTSKARANSARDYFFYYTGSHPVGRALQELEVLLHHGPSAPTGGLHWGVVTYHWTQVRTSSAIRSRHNVGARTRRRLLGMGGALAAPSTAYIYDWNLLPIGQLLWEKELMSYSRLPAAPVGGELQPRSDHPGNAGGEDHQSRRGVAGLVNTKNVRSGRLRSEGARLVYQKERSMRRLQRCARIGIVWREPFSPLAPMSMRRATRCPPGTTAPPSRPSSTSCDATTTKGCPQFVPARRAHRHLRPGRHALGRAPDVHAGDVLPGPGARAGGGQARTGRCRAVQDGPVRRPRGDRQAPDGGPGRRSSPPRSPACRRTQFQAEVKEWIAKARDPRWKRPYTELTYQPMQEVLQYLRANGYKTYIVTGGGQDFVRTYSEAVYGIPPEQVVGTAGVTNYGYDKDGKPFLTKEPKLLLNDNNAGKPEGIHLMIGRRPHAAFGNSTGDQQMLEYTKAGDGARLAMLRAARRRDARICLRAGPRAARHQGRRLHPGALRQRRRKGWTVISMKNDWKRIFAFE